MEKAIVKISQEQKLIYVFDADNPGKPAVIPGKPTVGTPVPLGWAGTCPHPRHRHEPAWDFKYARNRRRTAGFVRLDAPYAQRNDVVYAHSFLYGERLAIAHPDQIAVEPRDRA